MEYITLVHNHKKITAALFNLEGEVMNVIVKEPHVIKIGETFDCLIEGGKLEATVLKKDQNNLYLFVPCFKLDQFHNRRKSARCSIKTTGEVSTPSGTKRDITVVDISLHGIGFITYDSINPQLTHSLSFYLESNLVSCTILIKNETILEKEYRYGCEIHSINERDLFNLRKYILNTQLQRI